MRIIFFLSFFFLLLINVIYKGPVLLTFSHSSIFPVIIHRIVVQRNCSYRCTTRNVIIYSSRFFHKIHSQVELYKPASFLVSLTNVYPLEHFIERLWDCEIIKREALSVILITGVHYRAFDVIRVCCFASVQAEVI